MSSDESATLVASCFIPVDEDALASTISANLAMSFDILTAGARSKRTKRKRAPFDNCAKATAYRQLFQSVMNQPTDCIGRPIVLCQQQVKSFEETNKIVEAIAIPTITETGPVAVAIASVEDDNNELVFGRQDVPLCSSGEDCIAFMVDGPPNERLHAYRGPGHDPDCNECLLCIRHELGMLVQMYRVNGSKPPYGVLPMFSNPVNVPGGYRSSFCAVTPEDIAVVSGGVHIMGSPVGFRKTYNPYTKKWFIDQGAAVYNENNFFF
jgi:hypothetical protein